MCSDTFRFPHLPTQQTPLLFVTLYSTAEKDQAVDIKPPANDKLELKEKTLCILSPVPCAPVTIDFLLRDQ